MGYRSYFPYYCLIFIFYIGMLLCCYVSGDYVLFCVEKITIFVM